GGASFMAHSRPLRRISSKAQNSELTPGIHRPRSRKAMNHGQPVSTASSQNRLAGISSMSPKLSPLLVRHMYRAMASSIGRVRPQSYSAARLSRMSASRMPSGVGAMTGRSEEHTSELQSRENLVCRLLLEKK